mmetsp:Transcript_5119/g.7564  ORF Transcript_5119/g.7564 Transcript_5119/m.7564 type:complete len:360 (-) Transcript_5119:47-1126(-)
MACHGCQRASPKNFHMLPIMLQIIVIGAGTFNVNAYTFVYPSLSIFSANERSRRNQVKTTLFYRNDTKIEVADEIERSSRDIFENNSTDQHYLKRNSDNMYANELAVDICEKKLDYIGAGTLGDIMSEPSQDQLASNRTATVGDSVQNLASDNESAVSLLSTEEDLKIRCGLDSDRIKKIQNGENKCTSTSSGLVTSTGGTLNYQFGKKVPNLSPLDRIALTSNGNLQRIFSSFYDAPVHVHVDKCVRRKPASLEDDADAIWDRIVHLNIFDQKFCKATSIITVHSEECVKIVESGEVGIGQLFRYLDKLPTFSIEDAGRCRKGGLWRSYTLGCTEVTCVILEEFVPHAWEFQSVDTSL